MRISILQISKSDPCGLPLLENIFQVADFVVQLLYIYILLHLNNFLCCGPSDCLRLGDFWASSFLQISDETLLRNRDG